MVINVGDLLEDINLYHKDCIIGMKSLSENSIDLLLTDCPYGISFMGKSWDRAVPSIKIWKECLRVMKPGAYGFIMCIPRQDCLARMIVNLQDAGFNTDFSSIYWTYASGFPKAMDISKGIDKRACKEQLTNELGRKLTKEEEEEAWEDFRKVVGKYTAYDGANRNSDRHRSHKEVKIAEHNFGYKTTTFGTPITAPATPEAQHFEGWYSLSLKPAVEIIIVVQKSMMEKTYIEQALKWGNGCVNIDACRIPINDDENLMRNNDSINMFGVHNKGLMGNNKGRFPANLLVSDDVLGESFSRYFSLDSWNAEACIAANRSSYDTIPFYNIDYTFSSPIKELLSYKLSTRHRHGLISCLYNSLLSQVPSVLNDTSPFHNISNTILSKHVLSIRHKLHKLLASLFSGSFLKNFLLSSEVLYVQNSKEFVDLLDSYSANSHLCDELFHHLKVVSPELLLLLIYVVEHTLSCLRSDILEDRLCSKNHQTLECLLILSLYRFSSYLIYSDSEYINFSSFLNIENLPQEVQKTFPFMITPKPSKSEKNAGLEEIGGNKHPTCKPITLVSWLITLGSRPGDIVLDPFAGSVTTGIACVLEKRRFIGYELEKEYFEIGEARLNHYKNESLNQYMNSFDYYEDQIKDQDIDMWDL